jgi:hypothetical protein
MKRLILPLVLLFSGVALAAVYHFSLEVDVTVQDTNLTVAPESFTASISKGTTYVKEVDIHNSGGASNIYFEYVVEGPNPNSITVSFHDINSNTIASSKKPSLPAGSQENPAEITVNVHVKVKDKAFPSKNYYDIQYNIQAKET